MKFSAKFLLILVCFFAGFSCSQKPAQIVNRGKNIYNKNNELGRKKYREVKEVRDVKTVEKIKSEGLKSNQVEVVSDDTLYSISKEYQVTVHDLIKYNNLTPPYQLKSGTILKIPAPKYHEVKSGETLYAISRTYNMKIDQLIEMNDLKEPYGVKVGDKIRISKMENLAPQFRITSAEKPEEKESKKSGEVGIVDKVLDKFNHFSWPVRGSIISKFGPKSGGLYNDGINIKAKEGAVVKASEDGVVAYVGNELKGYGNLVIIKHGGGWITAYAHLGNSTVKRAQKITKGEKIGTVGSSGNVTSPQLYFGLRKGRDAVNPENYLK